MNLKDNWVWWLVAGVVILWWLRKGPHSVFAATPDAYYVPPAGGTAQPGTAPPASAALALTQVSPPAAVIPFGATSGPATAARSGRGHF